MFPGKDEGCDGKGARGWGPFQEQSPGEHRAQERKEDADDEAVVFVQQKSSDIGKVIRSIRKERAR